MSIRNKLFIWISLTFVLVISILIYFSLPRMEHIVFDYVMQIMRTKTEKVADDLDNWVLEHGSILKSMAVQIEINQLDTKEQSLGQFIQTMAEFFDDEFHNVYAGFSNRVHVSTMSTALPSDFDTTKRQWYIDTMQQKKLVVTEPYRDIRTNRLVASIAYPIKTSNPGVIGTDLYLDGLSSFISEVSFDPRTKVFLISKDGGIIYSNDDSLEFGKNIFAEYREILGETEQKESFEFEWQNTKYYGICVPIPTAGWRVVTAIPMSVLFEDNKVFFAQVGCTVLVGLFTLFLFIYVIIRQITKPLEIISQTAEQVSNGDFKIKFRHSGTIEIAYLVHSLEMMRMNILGLLKKKESLLAETKKQKQEIEILYGQTIKALVQAIEAKDDYTCGHSERVLYFSEKIGVLLEWNDVKLNDLRYAAILHDIGKIGVPLRILNKPGRLEADEYDLIKLHPGLGFRILQNISYLKNVSIAVLQHHERIDGHGYPYGLTDQQISPLAKVIAIADTYDAMTSKRPYRQALTMDAAKKELMRCAGTQFDSRIVALFCNKVLKEESGNISTTIAKDNKRVDM